MHRPRKPVRPILALGLFFVVASPLQAQDRLEITVDVVTRFLRAYDSEQNERERVAEQSREIDEKIRAFNECARGMQAAGEVSGSRLGGLAARAGVRARCGANSVDDFVKERDQLNELPARAANSAGGFRGRQYATLKDRIASFLGGARGGYAQSEIDALTSRRADLLGALEREYGAFAAASPAPSGRDVDDGRAPRGGRSARAPGVWTSDVAWEYIGEMLGMMYATGASVFEKPYEPGQWTRWSHMESWNPEETAEVERAFIVRTAEGDEWWRVKTIRTYGDGTRQVADTAVLEGLFRPVNEYIRQLVRMRARLPGQAEGNEMMVPQFFAGLSVLSDLFMMRPTEESIRGATVGTERVSVGGSSVEARRVRFGNDDGGTNEWWLAEGTPGGWVRFLQRNPVDDPGNPNAAETVTLEMVAHGTGARSELGSVP